MLDAGDFANDFEFQEHMQAIFAATLDAHTRYKKPACYNAAFVQPISFNLAISADAVEPVAYAEASAFAESYGLLFPDVRHPRALGKNAARNSLSSCVHFQHLAPGSQLVLIVC